MASSTKRKSAEHGHSSFDLGLGSPKTLRGMSDDQHGDELDREGRPAKLVLADGSEYNGCVYFELSVPVYNHNP